MSAGITLEQAKAKLQLWLDADDAVSKKQSYTINGRSLSMADISEIRDNIKFWNTKVVQLSRGRSGPRARGLIPMG